LLFQLTDLYTLALKRLRYSESYILQPSTGHFIEIRYIL
jgi:hypothetical protein